MRATVLVDTHILLWLLTGSKRLRETPWVKQHEIFAISPVSFLEIKFLHEVGKIQVDLPQILSNLSRDPRFEIDNPPLEQICLKAIELSWTRDPFDRFLVAHSDYRRIPFGTVDRHIRENYVHVLYNKEVKKYGKKIG